MAEESENKKIQPDIFSDVVPESETLPLDGEVVQKDYAKLTEDKGATSAGSSGGGSNTPPSDKGATVAEPTPGAESSPFSPPPTTGKTPEEIQTEAEQAVDLMLKGYSKMHDFSRFLAKKDEQQLAGEHVNGKINLDLTFPLPKGPVTIKEIVGEYNSSIDEAIVVTEEFKDNVRPKLVRIAVKRGWGLSDELSVLAYLVEDLATKAGLLIGLNKSMKMILDMGYESMKKKKKGVEEDTHKEPPIDTTGADNWREASDAKIVD